MKTRTTMENVMSTIVGVDLADLAGLDKTEQMGKTELVTSSNVLFYVIIAPVAETQLAIASTGKTERTGVKETREILVIREILEPTEPTELVTSISVPFYAITVPMVETQRVIVSTGKTELMELMEQMDSTGKTEPTEGMEPMELMVTRATKVIRATRANATVASKT